MSVNIYTSLPLALTANLINEFFLPFSVKYKGVPFDVNIYTSLPLALTANLINTFLHLFLRTDKLQFILEITAMLF